MPGAYRTQTDLINQALKNLGVLAAGNAADPEDYNFVQENVDPLLRTIAALDLAYIGDPSQIPGELFLPLADALAGECASKFGSTADDRVALQNKGLGGAGNVPVGAGSAAQTLRQINRGRPTYEPLRAVYF